MYDEAIRRLAIGAGTAALDIGCGSGGVPPRCGRRRARVAGLDASGAMVEIARERVPEADLRLGDLQFLPYDADAFDAVTSFNSFWFAADPIEALHEAGRVARPGALVFGRPERCEVSPMLQAVASLTPTSQPGEAPRSKFGLHEPGVLEETATAAGLVPQTAGDLVSTLEFEGDETRLPPRERMALPDRLSLTRPAQGLKVTVSVSRSSAPARRRIVPAAPA